MENYSNETFMRRCLQLAEHGKGCVAPNPMVGSVIVCKGKIIGEGFHRQYGSSHAEVNAINMVKDHFLLKESTLYVNLEPCSHYGKTPPCAELIIKKQIPKVVIGTLDPFPEVAGKGVGMLKEAGIELTVGILEDECQRLNRRFFTFHQKHRPYIFLKWAQSSDGFIDRIRQEGDGQLPVRFSDDFTQIMVHKMRAEESAIMVGSRTEKLDKPQLNVRCWFGQNPLIIKPLRENPLALQMQELYEQKIQSLVVEGGACLLQSFIDENLWDEARIEVSNIKLNAGVDAPVLSGVLKNVHKCKKTSVLIFHNHFKP